MSNSVPITVAHGDGIGPEIMAATLHILKEAGANLDIETIDIGEKVYLAGNSSGIEPSAWDSLRRTKVFLKAPITTPQGGGYKSLNVTVRKTLGLYANVRPCVSYHPFVERNIRIWMWSSFVKTKRTFTPVSNTARHSRFINV
jgi:isocitrate dehydrogenase